MKPTPQSIPGVGALYYRDFTIQRAAKTIVFSLVAAIGIHWVSQPGPSVVKVENSPVEDWVLQWGPAAALGIAALALLVLVRRYFWVKKVLCEGAAIKGIVSDMDVYEREEKRSDTSSAFSGTITRTYYAIICYAWQGVDKEIRLKLPNSPSTYQISKGREVDLIAHESAPNKPLIRAVYLGR